MQLRSYQQNLIDKTKASFMRGKKAPLLVSPTGSGKTVMFSYFAKRATEKGKRVLILAHRDELIDQISETLKMFSVEHSFIASGRYYFKKNNVHIASVFSLARRLDKINKPDFIIIDEAQHSIKGSTWGKVLDKFSSAFRVGVTATPSRLSGEPLNDIFDDLILGPTVKELIDCGHLSPYRLYAPSSINVDGVATRMGDFSKKELAIAADKPSITGDAVKEYKKLAHKKRAVVFCVSVEHAKHVAEQFRSAGYYSFHIDGGMDRCLRRQVVNDFRKGAIHVLTSCDLISEGFDLPSIEVAILLRPTKSLALYLQQVGRALRPFPGKEYALILDHAGNCELHGLPCEEREWSLDGRTNKTRAVDASSESVKICPKCFAAQFPGRTSCSFCGHVFEAKPREVKQEEGELSEVDLEKIRRERKREQGKADTLEDLIEMGKRRGYKHYHRWAKHVWNARQARKLLQGAA